MVLKSVFKWGLRLGLLALALAAIFLLSLDSLLRLALEQNLRQQARIPAEIGKFHLGLFRPVIEIKQLQLYNSEEFSNTPFLSIPDLYVEYDRAALARHEIHITRMRFNLGELAIVKAPDGQTNLFSLGLRPAGKSNATGGTNQELADFKRQTGLDFKGIDRLEVSVGKFRYVDLQNRKHDQEQEIGIANLIISNVVSTADLAGLGLVVGLRSSDFFKPLIAPGDSGPTLLNLLGL